MTEAGSHDSNICPGIHLVLPGRGEAVVRVFFIPLEVMVLCSPSVAGSFGRTSCCLVGGDQCVNRVCEYQSSAFEAKFSCCSEEHGINSSAGF